MTSTTSTRARKSASLNTTTAVEIIIRAASPKQTSWARSAAKECSPRRGGIRETDPSFVNAAFNIYRNYNGAGGEFGDTSIDANTSNIANSAVYASVDSSNPNRMVIVAINRTGSDQTTGIAVTNDRIFDHAEVYRFANSSASITRQADIQLDLLNAFQYMMPAWSVTTIVLISDGLPGDFNRDGRRRYRRLHRLAQTAWANRQHRC